MTGHTTIVRRAALPLALLCIGLAPWAPAGAITITYVNPGPADSRVWVGFANDASGNLTSDLVSAPAAASRNDTVYGPLPPIGMLPSFDAMDYGAAELGTNLNAPLGSGVRSIFAPLNPSFFQAHGETLAASGAYASHAFSYSGNASSSGPTPWIVHVDPSGVETAGTPALVTVTGTIAGHVTVAGAALADATWNVTTSSFGMMADASVLIGSTPGFKFVAGVAAWMNFPSGDIATPSGDPRLVPVDFEGQHVDANLPTPSYVLGRGAQIYIGPQLGVQFGR